ncbi:hypothetical protein DE146DRAFT_776467, partial [Phaeosphaeria sp. MPI-PUGE-AT-0046c]
IPLEANHSKIVKFDARSDTGYTSALERLRQYEHDAQKVIADRFLPKVLAAAIGPSKNVHWTVPRNVNSLFTGRSAIVKRMRSTLSSNEGSQVQGQRRFVIIGMGGQGKSELCLRVAHADSFRFWGIFWVDVDSPTTATKGFIAIAQALAVSESIECSRHALASTRKPRLLVLDNADDPNFDYGIYIPSGNRGAVIITSRVPDCQQYNTHGWETLRSLGMHDATQLLLSAAKVPEESWQICQEDAESIAHLLGSHTLALLQAGAYISKGYCKLDQYSVQYQKQRKRVLGQYFKQEQSRYRHVYATFEASASILQNHEGEAGKDALELLAILSMLHWGLLPLQVFEQAWRSANRWFQYYDVVGITSTPEVAEISRWHLDQLPGFLGVRQNEWDDDRLRTAVHLLASLSLVTIDSFADDMIGFSMHSLAHAWAKDRQTLKGQNEAWLRTGCVLLLLGWSDEWRVYEATLQPHVHSFLSPAMKVILSYGPQDLVLPTLLRCGWILLEMKAHVRLERLLQDIYLALDITPSQPSRDHLPVWELTVRSMMGMHNSKQAMPLLEHMVEVRKTLADGHVDRLRSQLDLAVAYRENGLHEQAIELLERLVGTTLVETHPIRLETVHELAVAYHWDGQTHRAIEMLEHLLEVSKTTLVETHPFRLATESGLAAAYRTNRNTKQAIRLLEHVVKVKETVLTDTHPLRLASEFELALAYRDNGNIERAMKLLEHIVKVGESVLAETHPLRLASENQLADAYMMKGNTARAIELLEHVVKVGKSVLEETHPRQLVAEHKLAFAYHINDQEEQAIVLIKHVIEVERRILGVEDRKRMLTE